MLEIIIKSMILGALGGFAAAAGASRMFHAPEVQAMGSFRGLGELNACKGDPMAHFSFGLGFLFNAAGSVIGAGALTQDVWHRIVPNWAAASLLIKNKKVEETLYDPAKMAIAGAVIGAITVAFLNSIASIIPESLSAIAAGILGPASSTMIDMIIPVLFILAALDAGKLPGMWGLALGGLSQLIMGNATPGAVLGILIGQTVAESGWNKSAKVMLAIIVVLFIAIGQGRGFWANALGMYGNYFISELNPKPDYTKGRMFLEQSCQQKDPYGCAQLGTLYVSGKGVTQNVTQGLQLFALSCKLANSIPDEFIQVDNNIGLGCFYLGQSYLDNKTLDPNGDQAIGYLNQACDLQAAPACSLLANYYQQHGAIDSAHLYREKACYAGMTEECVNEAVFYHHVGNETEANRLLQVGCELNNDNACTLLASNLLYGIGIQQNVPQALTLVRQACNHNSALACFYLAQLYHTGITNVPGYQLPRNLDIAHDLYLKSCNLGNDLSCIELQKLEQLIAPQPKP